MPLVVPTIAATLGSNLGVTGHLGVGMPKFAQAVALGVTLWAAKASVNVQGTGAAGTGVASGSLTVPQPLILSSLQASFKTAKISGVFSSRTTFGLANGLFAAFPQGIMLATVIGVGLGSGVAKIVAPPATPAFQQAMASLGMVGTGSARMALGLGRAFDKIFAVFSILVPIVGPAGTTPSVGSGTGKIV